jgi:hypothetical protein
MTERLMIEHWDRFDDLRESFTIWKKGNIYITTREIPWTLNEEKEWNSYIETKAEKERVMTLWKEKRCVSENS